MAIDLKDLTAQKGGDGAKAPFSPRAVVATKIKPDLPKTNVKYFYSHKPNLGFYYHNTRIKFTGNYYETSDPAIIDYILEHYGQHAVEITEEQKIDGQTTKG